MGEPSPGTAPAAAEESGGSGPRVGWKLLLALAAACAALAVAASFWSPVTDYSWRSPIAGARFQAIADFDAFAQAAAISRDGNLVAFLSDRDGQMDVWLTRVGSGRFDNLTRGSVPELVNPPVRALGFSPDGTLVTFWTRKDTETGVWAVPVVGGQAKAYLEGVAEFDWSRDGSLLAYNTPAGGDPLFVSKGGRRPDDRPISTAGTGMHSHFPLWAPDAAFIYQVRGALPDKLDIWRITPAGGTTQRITSHGGVVSHPALLDRRTLLYLATDAEGAGPQLYSVDVERRISHKLTSGPERFTSLAASADGRRLVATRASPTRSLWRLPVGALPAGLAAAARIALGTGAGFSPRLGPDYLLYVSASGNGESIWKVAGGAGTELWSGKDAQISGAPAISRDGGRIAFSVRQRGKTQLYVMRSDGTEARVIADSLDLEGAPAWAPDGAVRHGGGERRRSAAALSRAARR